MSDILIDLGHEWGHVVPLGVLEKINHIEIGDNGHIHVTCDVSSTKQHKLFRFKSRKPFDEEQLLLEKSRLLGFSNGIVSFEDMQHIIQSIETQTGISSGVILKDSAYDISYARRIWSTLHDEPHFRFTLHYDIETQSVLIDESHNEVFANKIIPEWLDDVTLKVLTEDEDRLLMFAYEVIYRMAEPILPEGEEGAYINDGADIPMMGSPMGSATQTVDLSKINKR